MTGSPHQLYAVEFHEADQTRLVGFTCGEEAWSRHVAEWIRGPDVLDSIVKCGFELIPDVLRQRDHLVMKLWIGESGK
jgi:hypothetical protein